MKITFAEYTVGFMKKLTLILCLIILASSITSCAKNENEAPADSNTESNAVSLSVESHTETNGTVSLSDTEEGTTEVAKSETDTTDVQTEGDGDVPDVRDTEGREKDPDVVVNPSSGGEKAPDTTKRTVTPPKPDTTVRQSDTTVKKQEITTEKKTENPPPTPPAEVVPAESNPIKGKQKTSPSADYNIPKVSKSQLKGGGPYTDQQVYIGENDFMFIGESIPDYEGTMFKDSRLMKLAKIMNERNEWAKENGIKLYFVVCPNKASIYGDYLSSLVTPADYTRLDQAIDYMNENSEVKVIDLRSALKNARNTYGDDLYYNYDTHWNSNGGFVAYTEIMKYITKDFPNAVTFSSSDFNIKNYETYMKDMPWYLGYYDAYYDEGPVYSLKVGPAAKLVSKQSETPTGQYAFSYRWKDGYHDGLKFFKYKSKNTSAPSVYMMRDSYAISLVPFFKESFSESTFSWTSAFSKSEILSAKPDIVICEVVERSLMSFINARSLSD